MDISFFKKPIKGRNAVILLIIVTIIAIFAGNFTGKIINKSREHNMSILKQNSRFITKESYEIDGRSYYRLTIIEDKETKILYLMSTSNGNQYGLTPWLDKDGKPMRNTTE